MAKSKSVFRHAFIAINIVLIATFILVLIYQIKTEVPILNAFLTAASTAGFLGLLGQMILILVQESYQRRTYKICYVCRESPFSETISNGIKNYFADEVDVEFEIKVIPKDPNEKKIFIEFLQKETKKFNGIIIRPIEVSTELFLTVQSLVKQKKEVVLVDLNFSEDQVASFPSFNPPVYVGSDFNYGGKLVADQIVDLIEHYGKESTEVIALLGPENLPSARKRSKNIVWELSKNNYTDICTFMNLESFDVSKCIDEFCRQLSKLDPTKVKGKNIILFCGNDSVAIELMKRQITEPESPFYKFVKEGKSIHYIGYDGIKDSGTTNLLDRYSLQYTTIDVLPYKQGEKAAELVLHNLTNEQNVLKLTELIQPKIICNKELA